MSYVLTADELYVRLHTGNAGDVAFYLRVSSGAERVLELGAGIGRITLPLLAAGHRVTAVDRNDDRLVRLASACPENERERLTTHVADLRAFDTDERFERVLLPYNVLFALGGAPGVLAAFSVAERLLAPEGEIWFDVYCLDGFEEAARSGEVDVEGEDREEVLAWTDEHGLTTVFESTRIDLPERRLDVRYEAVRSSGAVPRGDAPGAGTIVGRSELVHHFLESEQLLELIDQAGLEPILIAADFDGTPFDEGAEHLVVGAVRKATEPS